MARQRHAVELLVGDIFQRLRSEKSHQQLGRRGFDSRHLHHHLYALTRRFALRRSRQDTPVTHRVAPSEVFDVGVAAERDRAPVLISAARVSKATQTCGDETQWRSRQPVESDGPRVRVAAQREVMSPAPSVDPVLRHIAPGERAHRVRRGHIVPCGLMGSSAPRRPSRTVDTAARIPCRSAIPRVRVCASAWQAALGPISRARPRRACAGT